MIVARIELTEGETIGKPYGDWQLMEKVNKGSEDTLKHKLDEGGL